MFSPSPAECSSRANIEYARITFLASSVNESSQRKGLPPHEDGQTDPHPQRRQRQRQQQRLGHSHPFVFSPPPSSLDGRCDDPSRERLGFPEALSLIHNPGPRMLVSPPFPPPSAKASRWLVGSSLVCPGMAKASFLLAATSSSFCFFFFFFSEETVLLLHCR